MSGVVKLSWVRQTLDTMEVSVDIDKVREAAGLIGTPDNEVVSRLRSIFSSTQMIALLLQHVTPEVKASVVQDSGHANFRFTVNWVATAPETPPWQPELGKVYRIKASGRYRQLRTLASGGHQQWNVFGSALHDSRQYTQDELEEMP